MVVVAQSFASFQGVKPTPREISPSLKSQDVLQYPLWFGGSASCMAVCISHPLDLVKVRMQTALPSSQMGTIATVVSIVRNDGLSGLYHGLSAGLVRQLMYGSTRFALYESIKDRLSTRSSLSPGLSVLIPAAAASGFAGGVVGNPADIANVRMQFDKSLPRGLQRSYRNVIDAWVQLGREEGWRGFIRGLWPNCIRASLMTSCQLASYDGFKRMLVEKLELTDVASTQLMASILASLVATTICSPVDVIKTKLMSSSSQGSVMQILRETRQKEGIRWVFRGWLPSFARLGPHTVATLLFLEQHKRLYRSLRTRNDNATMQVL